MFPKMHDMQKGLPEGQKAFRKALGPIIINITSKITHQICSFLNAKIREKKEKIINTSIPQYKTIAG